MTTESTGTESPASTTTETSATTTTIASEAAAPIASHQNFFDSLPDDIKNEPSIQNFKGKDAVEIVKGYVNAQKELGSRIRIPGKDASKEAVTEFHKKLETVPGVVKLPDPSNKEEIDAFYNKLGRPLNAADYKVEVPEQLKADDNMINNFKTLAHGIGLTKQQVEALTKFDTAAKMGEIKAINDEAVSNRNKINELWGKDADVRLQGAKAVLDHYQDKFPEDVNVLRSTRAGNNLVVIAMAAELSKFYRESGLISGEGYPKFGITPGEAKAQIKEIRDNKAHDYYSNDPKRREGAMKQVSELYGIAYPEEQK